MTPPVAPTRPPGAALRPDRAHHAERVRAIARLLDTAVRVPGTGIRFGLDAFLGLVPVLGDVAGAAASGYIVLAAARLGAPPSVLLRMLVNIGVDTVTGSVPLLGDLFDVGWKANARNAALLDGYLGAPSTTRASSRVVVAGVVVALLLLLGAGIALAVWVVRALVGLVT